MANGVDITIQLLAKSKNTAATRLLEAAIQSSNEAVRKSAGKTLIATKGSKSTTEIIRAFNLSEDNLIEIINDNRDKILPALRAAIGGKDRDLAKNAFRIIYTQRYYEALPFLLTIFREQGDDEDDSFLSDGILRLLEKYIEAVEERKNRRLLMGTIFPEIVSALTAGVKNFHRNDPDLFLIVLMRLYPYLTEEHRELTQVFRNASSPAYLALFKLLLERRHSSIWRFIFYCLGTSSPPPLALTVFSKRSDQTFLNAILKMFEEPVTPDMHANLAQMQRVEWLENIRVLLDLLDGQAQKGLVVLVRNLDISTGEALSILTDIFRHGQAEGRLAAFQALPLYEGERIDRIIWDAAEDSNPQIQVEALTQLAKRGLPNANSRILQLAESPHEKVRDAVSQLLPNFRFGRFFESFDQMNETQRKAMFHMVCQLDPQVVDQLAQRLIVGPPIERARALLCIEYGNLASQLEDTLCGVLTDDEVPALRARAALLLASGRRELSRSTLVQALHRDSATEVRDAAKTALENRPAHWNTSTNEETNS